MELFCENSLSKSKYAFGHSWHDMAFCKTSIDALDLKLLSVGGENGTPGKGLLKNFSKFRIYKTVDSNTTLAKSRI